MICNLGDPMSLRHPVQTHSYILRVCVVYKFTLHISAQAQTWTYIQLKTRWSTRKEQHKYTSSIPHIIYTTQHLYHTSSIPHIIYTTHYHCLTTNKNFFEKRSTFRVHLATPAWRASGVDSCNVCFFQMYVYSDHDWSYGGATVSRID